MVDMFDNEVKVGDCVIVNLDNVGEWHGLAMAMITALKDDHAEVEYLKHHSFITEVLHESNKVWDFEIMKIGSFK